jgi:hypothetical protein
MEGPLTACVYICRLKRGALFNANSVTPQGLVSTEHPLALRLRLESDHRLEIGHALPDPRASARLALARNEMGTVA